MLKLIIQIIIILSLLSQSKQQLDEDITFSVQILDMFNGKDIPRLEQLFKNYIKSSKSTKPYKVCPTQDQEDEPIPQKYNFKKEFTDCYQPAYNQKSSRCSHGYIISGISSIEDRYCRQTYEIQNFGMVEFTDCEKSKCIQGSVQDIFDIGMSKGFIYDECFSSCKEIQNCKRFQIQGYCFVKKHEEIQREILRAGPVVCSIKVYYDLLNYKDGIYKVLSTSQQIQGLQAVKVIGWGENQNGLQYWIIENIWGQNWGQYGIAYIEKSLIQNDCIAAEFIPTNMLLAIKQISKRNIIQNGIEKQLQQEIKIQQYLNHPNILKMYGFFSDDQNVYLLLELSSHGNIQKEIQSQKVFNEKKAAIYIRQVCEGLSFCHQQGIIHRDIKPENILNSFGVLKISDFGWSVYTEEKRQTFCGTLDYISPEVIQGKDYDSKVDVWSIGILIYEMLIDPNQRISIEEVLKHEWILNNTNNCLQEWDRNISCKNFDNQDVSWFTIQKVPTKNAKQAGVHFGYFDNTFFTPDFQLSDTELDDPSSPLYKTLIQVNKNKNIQLFGWNDENPYDHKSPSGAHSKGVIAIDLKNMDSIYIGHSLPAYLAIDDDGKIQIEVPESANIYGQSLICMSLDQNNVEQLAINLRISKISVYFSNITDEDNFPNVSQLANNKQKRVKDQQFAYGNLSLKYSNAKIISIHKNNSEKDVSIIDLAITNSLRCSLVSETWGRPYQDSNCDGPFTAENVTQITIGDITWNSRQDHSKWTICKNDDNISFFVCIGDMNRMTSQMKRGGSFYCINNKNLWQAYKNAISGFENCEAK